MVPFWITASHRFRSVPFQTTTCLPDGVVATLGGALNRDTATPMPLNVLSNHANVHSLKVRRTPPATSTTVMVWAAVSNPTTTTVCSSVVYGITRPSHAVQ